MKKKNLPEISVAKERVKVLEASLAKYVVSLDTGSIVDSLNPLNAARELKNLRRLLAIAEKKEG
jgi:hypothetical protein